MGKRVAIVSGAAAAGVIAVGAVKKRNNKTGIMSTLTNMLKKASDTAQGIPQNIK